MSKPFLEVFESLKLDQKLSMFFGQVLVERVVTTKEKDFLKVYISCDKLILREHIVAVEREIKKQLFPHNQLIIKLYEKYHLSSQYNPEKLTAIYQESILEELREYDRIEYNMFKKAQISFPTEQSMELTIADTVLHRMKEEDFVHVLDKIYNERCGMKVIINIAYEELEEEEIPVEFQYEFVNGPAGLYTPKEDAGKEQEILPKDGSTDSEKGKAEQKKDGVQKKSEDGQAGNGDAKKFKRTEWKKSGGFDRGSIKKSDDPDVIYGRDIEEDAMPISEIQGEIGEVVIRGKIRAFDSREIRGEKTILMFDVTDFTDTMTIKMFCRNDQVSELTGNGISVGSFVKIKGIAMIDRFDNELTIGSLVGVKKIPSFESSRVDNAPKKRVELHCHSKMSDMDAVTDVSSLMKRAKKWGWPAMAITDHGNVQAFTEANHAIDHDDEFKILYGVEGYLVDDSKKVVTNPMGQTLDDTFVVFDIETTGFSPVTNRIIEIGAVKVEKGEIVDRFSTFVNPDVPIPFEIEQLTSINDNMVMDSPQIDIVLPQFLAFIEGSIVVAHNAEFDVSFIKENARRQGLKADFTYIDTVGLARYLLPGHNKYTLDAVAKALGISLDHHHRAVDDAACTAEIFVKFIKMMKEEGMHVLEDINVKTDTNVEAIRKLPYYHIILIAKNGVGRTNLYKLVSESHLTYFNRRPRMPKTLIDKYREGIIVGSACEAGELFKAVLEGKADSEIARIVNFYDYLEIQPIANNHFLIESERERNVQSEEDLIELNRKIVKLGEQFHKPVVATCDVHFMDPQDEIYRRIILAGNGYDDADHQPPLFLRTTEEMLAEFAYLGAEKAEEIVITNTNMIADMCDKIWPVRPDKCPPVIENSDEMLTKICYDRAHEIYGENLPEIVEKRLEKELHSIISNGFAVMYIIAQKLVWKSNEDGYLVGSRGSVGSSFVACMAGITEVNSLSPHYICPHCHYSDFDSPEVKAFSGMAGCDMPDRDCPECGTRMIKEGFDIPFETFLGFKGNKEPDIDLNFSGEYQSKAHKYTEVIFGYGQTFRAGTIGTLADKTAFGYVKNYFEERGMHKRVAEINRIVEGCVGIRRTTGQHPGGIVVLPVGEEIYSFTPVQHPANDMTTDTITTHFDYHSIDHNLLKLDILGHDDPTMIRMLQDLTGIDPLQIPLDDKKVMSLFQDTSALGVTPDEILGCKLGALGIPEFGTDFAMQMLIDTQPKYFSDLVRIAGLSHGTDVWLGNAQELIKSGQATISTAICTRDDIMIYLISMGLDSEESFKIMEAVRKGTVAKGKCGNWEAWKQDMIDHNVPDWYIWSCEKIQYMFPKAHAAAYVMMAWRIAYCKIYYPLAYYCAFFSIRATAFSYELFCQGKRAIENLIDDYKKRSDTLSKKEQDQLKDARIVQEMYARGYEFLPIDLFKAHSRNFQIVDGKIMPAISSIDGLGEKAADSIMEASKAGPYLSKDDLRQRAKIGKSTTDLMTRLGLLDNLPETNQLSLFDFV